MVHFFSAGLVIFKIDKKKRFYLLLQYPHGHWDFAKGKIEKGESKHDAALRELQEETGLSATIMPGFERSFDYFFTQEGERIKKTVYFFIGQATTDKVTLSYEHSNYAWLSYADALERLTYDNAKELLQSVEQFLHNK